MSSNFNGLFYEQDNHSFTLSDCVSLPIRTGTGAGLYTEMWFDKKKKTCSLLELLICSSETPKQKKADQKLISFHGKFVMLGYLNLHNETKCTKNTTASLAYWVYCCCCCMWGVHRVKICPIFLWSEYYTLLLYCTLRKMAPVLLTLCYFVIYFASLRFLAKKKHKGHHGTISGRALLSFVAMVNHHAKRKRNRRVWMDINGKCADVVKIDFPNWQTALHEFFFSFWSGVSHCFSVSCTTDWRQGTTNPLPGNTTPIHSLLQNTDDHENTTFPGKGRAKGDWICLAKFPNRHPTNRKLCGLFWKERPKIFCERLAHVLIMDCLFHNETCLNCLCCLLCSDWL